MNFWRSLYFSGIRSGLLMIFFLILQLKCSMKKICNIFLGANTELAVIFNNCQSLRRSMTVIPVSILSMGLSLVRIPFCHHVECLIRDSLSVWYLLPVYLSYCRERLLLLCSCSRVVPVQSCLC